MTKYDEPTQLELQSLYDKYMDDFDPTPQYLYDSPYEPMDFDTFCETLREEQAELND